MADFSEYRLTLVGGRSLLGYTGDPEGAAHSPVLGQLFMGGLLPDQTVEFGWNVVQRWNACEDAEAAATRLANILNRSVTEEGAAAARVVEEIRAILRRAINGEG